jgi:hypothetical protein
VEREVEIPLPPALNTDRVRRKGGVALVDVDVEGDRLLLRLLRPLVADDDTSALTEPEEEALAKGGVEAVTANELRRIAADGAAAYQHLRGESLGIEDAAHRLGVTTSRVRQRLAERSLYGLKEGNTWLLPAFQFAATGLVPRIEAVLKRLPADISPLAVARWFASANSDLCTRDEEERPLSPRQWLLEGNPPELAAELAAAL